jgi:hypothetical protein
MEGDRRVRLAVAEMTPDEAQLAVALKERWPTSPRRCLMSPRDDSAPPNETDGVKSDGIAAGHIGQHRVRSIDPVEPRQRVSARQTIAWPYAGGIVGYHLLALLALVPWFFTWSGVVLAFAGLFVFGTLGINLGYHRLLTPAAG